MREKVDPYLRPLYDALYDVLPPEKVERDLETGVIEIAPLAFMRGRTLANAFVILDEAQNTTSMQMKMFLTRLGEGSKMVITGDPRRSTCRRALSRALRRRSRLLTACPVSRRSVSPTPTSSVAISSRGSSRHTTKSSKAS